jgi:hypothetical protein
MFLAVFIYSKFTTLGDAASYIHGDKLNWDNFYYNPASMMIFLGLLFSAILGGVLAHFPFVILSFYGVCYSVKRLELTNNQFFTFSDYCHSLLLGYGPLLSPKSQWGYEVAYHQAITNRNKHISNT